jgi:NAD(P)-dependent dehydrogenase (short-subunit alcohol dehydrogenase family)
MDIAKKVAVMVGGGSGMGRATALELADRGAVIAVLDLPGGKGPDTVAELGGPATFHPCDVTDSGATETALDSVMEAHGAMHVAVNTAGGGWSKRIIGRDGPLPLAVFR